MKPNTKIALTELEKQLKASSVVIARPQSILEQLATGDNVVYPTYYGLSASGVVLPTDDEWDRPRQTTDVALFTNYHTEIRFGALSSDGTGLYNYGEFFIELREDMISHRTSVLEENSVSFVQRMGSGVANPGTPLPQGYRSCWHSRHKVGVAKLAHRLLPTMSPADIQQLVLTPGSSTGSDEFIEAHVFGPITRRTIRRVARYNSGKKQRKGRKKNAILDALRKRLDSVGVEVLGF